MSEQDKRPFSDDPSIGELLKALDRRLESDRATQDPNPSKHGPDDFDSFRARCERAFEGDALADGKASEALRTKRVAERVLAASTREDLRRRGDVGLVLNFVSERLRESRLLRVAAAILLVQITVVPLIAYHMVKRETPSTLKLDFTPPEKELIEDLPVLSPSDYLLESDDTTELDDGATFVLDQSFMARIVERLDTPGLAPVPVAVSRASRVFVDASRTVTLTRAPIIGWVCQVLSQAD